MKLTLALSAMIVFSGCPTKTDRSDLTKKGGPGGDSPIVISDGSVHLKHKSSNATDGDFQIVNTGSGTVVEVNDNSGAMVQGYDCKNVTITPPPASDSKDCTKNTPKLQKTWSMDVFNDSGDRMFTIGSPDNSTMIANLYGNALDPEADGTNDTKKGADLIVAPANLITRFSATTVNRKL